MSTNWEMVEFERASNFFEIILDEEHPCDGCKNRDICSAGMSCSVYANYLNTGKIETHKGKKHFDYIPHPMKAGH